jgi:hypothetical protein
LGRSATKKKESIQYGSDTVSSDIKLKNVYGYEFRVNRKHKIEKSPFGNTCGVLRVAAAVPAAGQLQHYVHDSPHVSVGCDNHLRAF